MAKFPETSVREALERSLRNADGLTAVHSATVAAARTLAERIDHLSATGFVDDDKLDNVTVPTFLKYCQALGLTVDATSVKKQEKTQTKPAPQPVDELAVMRSRRRFVA